MRILKWIPNILTLTRIILTISFLLLLHDLHLYVNNTVYFTLAVIVFVLICLTDFIDGKIARKINTVTTIGGLLDVAEDLIFILSSTFMLSLHNFIPMWYMVLVLVKFLEFVITSYIINNNQSNVKSLFIFDFFGRVAAVNFFLMPGMALFIYIGLKVIIINIFLYITLVLVLISSFNRCTICYKLLKIKNKNLMGYGIKS